MSAVSKLLNVQTKRTLRDPASVFFMLAFAPMFVLIMGAIFGSDPRPEFDGKGFIEANLVAFTSIVIAITSFLMIPTDIISQRETGALRRFRATPLRPSAYIAADVVVRFVILMISVSLMLVLGMTLFDAELQGNFLSVLGALVLGVFAFLAVGYLLAALLPSPQAAQALGNSITYPLIVLSGGAVPLDVMPDGVRDVAQFSPLTQLVEFLQGLWEGESWSDNWVSVAVLGGLLVVAAGLAQRVFRWE
ncbi:ABC transporter permease [Streptomyces sp. 7-21]|uniref:ABC transporter permease n=1 Tax=Streptomyces sp. 7-21 TaxID=2802283 RepID=UPI00191EBB19|nr:ABC transporter permease [Streptomyces sp. 7-21]MBL1065918.1 ABC transporter permease [Streptomyces sp. 7-21]